jgi:hypothetical protein
MGTVAGDTEHVGVNVLMGFGPFEGGEELRLRDLVLVAVQALPVGQDSHDRPLWLNATTSSCTSR